MNVLVVDVGGNNVKLMLSETGERRKFPSGPDLSAKAMVAQTLEKTSNWDYGVISLGLPCPVSRGKPIAEPPNLGSGWVDFDYTKAFGKPVRIMNDAAMQALGAYRGGRMLFLGFGTGLGSTLIADNVVLPLELGELHYKKSPIFHHVSDEGLLELKRREWEAIVHEVVAIFRKAFLPDDVVIGGGNADELKELPEGARRGGNEDVLPGGVRLWEELPNPAESDRGTWKIA